MSRHLLLLGFLACVPAFGCTTETPTSTTDAADQNAASIAGGERREWPARQVNHVASGRGKPAALDAALDDEQAFAAQLGNLAATALQLEGLADYESAQEARREIVEKLERRYGSRSWQAVNGRVALKHTERLGELTFEQRRRLIEIGEAERWSQSLAAQGDGRGALEEAQRAVELTRAIWGDDYYLTANRWFDEAQLCHAVGENEAAEALFQKTLAFRRQNLGREHPDYVAVLNALAIHHQALEQNVKAEKLLREAAELDKVIWGERHPAYATQLNNLGMLYHAAGKRTAAIDLLREAAEIRREALGEEHALYAHSLYNLGSVHYAAGNQDQAAPQFEEALPIFERDLGPGHQMTLLAKNNLAMVELARKNLGQAEKLLREVVEITRDQRTENPSSFAAALSQLAMVYSHQESYREADELLAEAQQVQEKSLGRDHLQVGKTLELRGAILRKLNQPAEAEKLEGRAKQIAQPPRAP